LHEAIKHHQHDVPPACLTLYPLQHSRPGLHRQNIDFDLPFCDARGVPADGGQMRRGVNDITCVMT
jgi:hypothetical protein